MDHFSSLLVISLKASTLAQCGSLFTKKSDPFWWNQVIFLQLSPQNHPVSPHLSKNKVRILVVVCQVLSNVIPSLYFRSCLFVFYSLTLLKSLGPLFCFHQQAERALRNACWPVVSVRLLFGVTHYSCPCSLLKCQVVFNLFIRLAKKELRLQTINFKPLQQCSNISLILKTGTITTNALLPTKINGFIARSWKPMLLDYILGNSWEAFSLSLWLQSIFHANKLRCLKKW